MSAVRDQDLTSRDILAAQREIQNELRTTPRGGLHPQLADGGPILPVASGNALGLNVGQQDNGPTASSQEDGTAGPQLPPGPPAGSDECERTLVPERDPAPAFTEIREPRIDAAMDIDRQSVYTVPDSDRDVFSPISAAAAQAIPDFDIGQAMRAQSLFQQLPMPASMPAPVQGVAQAGPLSRAEKRADATEDTLHFLARGTMRALETVVRTGKKHGKGGPMGSRPHSKNRASPHERIQAAVNGGPLPSFTDQQLLALSTEDYDTFKREVKRRKDRQADLAQFQATIGSSSGSVSGGVANLSI